MTAFNHQFRRQPSGKSNVFQRFFNGNQVRFSSGTCRLIRSDYGTAVITLATCVRLPAWSSGEAALGHSRVMDDEFQWRGKRPQTNSRKSSQRAFAISRFWWLLAPFFMTRQNQKSSSPEKLSRTRRFLRSQVLSLRVFSAFWLTAGEPAPLKMANARGKRLSLES